MREWLNETCEAAKIKAEEKGMFWRLLLLVEVCPLAGTLRCAHLKRRGWLSMAKVVTQTA
jgi:hypothetical protein